MTNLIIKLRSGAKGLTPFVSRVVRDGAAQRAFTEHIGKAAGACVRAGVHKGMTGGAIKAVVAKCGHDAGAGKTWTVVGAAK